MRHAHSFVLPALAAALLAVGSAAPAAAQDTTAAARTDDEARSLFAAGQIAYGDGRYESALESFERAYELSQRVDLLYNIGLTAEHLRHDEQALQAYEGYLEGRPDSEHRSAVEARIQILREAIASHAPAPAPAPEATPAPAPAPVPSPATSSGPDAGALALTIGGGVVALAGVALLIVGVIDTNTVQNASYPSHWSDVRSAYDLAFPLSLTGAVALGVGAAAAIGGVIWIALGGGGHTEVALTPNGVSLRGSF